MRKASTRARALAAFVLLALAAALAPASADASEREAVSVVRALYERHAELAASGRGSAVTSPRVATQFFDPFVAGQLSATDLGFDPLYNAQDFDITGLRIRPDPEMPVLRGTYFVRATFRNFGAPQTLTFLLRPADGSGPLRIIDIEGPGWRLSDLLR